MKTLQGLSLATLLALAGACGKTAETCSPSNCQGCCNAAGFCDSGRKVDACGTGGETCASCAATESCLAGACVTGALGGGAGNTGGGSGSTGGGSGSIGGGTANEDGGTPDAGPTLETTYYKDVLPITQARCLGCHTAGGIGPFPLDSYADAQSKAGLMADATLSKRMPPWKADNSCGGPFVGDRSLSQAQIDTIQNWVLEGALEGNPADAPPPRDAGADNLERIDFTATMPSPYTPTQTDDYRCFLIDPALTAAKTVVGYNIEPGSKKTVHHVILYIVDQTEAVNKDAQSPGIPGWPCFGGAEVNTEGALGAWAPGGAAIHFPSGTGIQIGAGKVLAMQVHYNTDNGVEADQSTFELMYAAPGENPTQAYLIPLAADGFNIPANAQGYEYHETYGNPVGLPLRLWGLLPHMHTRGTHINMSSDSECLVDVPRWDFHWQSQYFRPQPYVMGATDHVTMTCSWDNPDDHNVTWGEGTSDEMCFAFVYATL